MKYCLNYVRDSKHLSTAEELTILYEKRTPYLIEWVERLPEEQRLILDISNLVYSIKNDFDILKEVQKKHSNLSIKFKDFEFDIEKELAEMGITYFYDMFADTWDKLNFMLSRGVSDVYVVSELAFSLDKVRQACFAHNTQIRVFPNIAQSSIFKNDGVKSLTKFFIRPEDVKFYEPYADVFEMFCPVDQQDIYIDIYKEGSWTTNLKFLIKEFDVDVVSAQLVRFGTERISCGKRCAYGDCRRCETMIDIATLLADYNIGMVKKEEPKHYTREEAEEVLESYGLIKNEFERVNQISEKISAQNVKPQSIEENLDEE